VLLGYGTDSSSNNNPTLGFADASLACNSSDDLPVAVYFNSTYLREHVSAFKGVSAASDSSCNGSAAAAAAGPTSIRALLYFCSSNHQLTLVNPVVKGLWLPAARKNGTTSSSSSWLQAILAFGGSINASITRGLFAQSSADMLIAVRQHAKLSVSNTSFVRNNSTLAGKQLVKN
jgi:hypothetical protein